MDTTRKFMKVNHDYVNTTCMSDIFVIFSRNTATFGLPKVSVTHGEIGRCVHIENWSFKRLNFMMFCFFGFILDMYVILCFR